MADWRTMTTLRTLCRTAALAGILLLGLWLRLASWGQNRFMEDEALYSYWGLQIASGADPLLDLEPVDKPPLHPYTLALSFALLVPSRAGGEAILSPTQIPQAETAARMPSLLASASSILLAYGLAKALWPAGPADHNAVRAFETPLFRELTALLAALLMALSPLDIVFASTAYTDPLMAALALAAILVAARDRMGLAGLLAGLSVATKQQGLYFLPLIVLAGRFASPNARPGSVPTPSGTVQDRPGLASAWFTLRRFGQRAWHQRWVRFVVAFLLVMAGMLWWDAVRIQRPGFLRQSLVSYGGLGPAGSRPLAARGLEWLRLAGALWVSPWANGLLLTAVIVWLASGLARRQRALIQSELALLFFLLSFLLLHWLAAFQTWDRYLLGLVPLAAVLAARSVLALGSLLANRRWWGLYTMGIICFLLASLSGPASRAAAGRLPYGGDHGAYDGIDELSAFLRAEAPERSVLYHYWLGYHYRFYLYGAPLRTHWYPDLDDLVRDALIYRREVRYIAFPSWRDSEPARRALAAAGITLAPVLETERRDGTVSFRLFHLEGP